MRPAVATEVETPATTIAAPNSQTAATLPNAPATPVQIPAEITAQRPEAIAVDPASLSKLPRDAAPVAPELHKATEVGSMDDGLSPKLTAEPKIDLSAARQTIGVAEDNRFEEMAQRLEMTAIKPTIMPAGPAAQTPVTVADVPAPGFAPVATVAGTEIRDTTGTTVSQSSAPSPSAMRQLIMSDADWPNKITSMIREARDLTQGEIEIGLQPERLGKMTITLDLSDSKNVAVTIVTDNEAAAKMLNDNQSKLADMMGKAGLDLTQHQANAQGRDTGGQGQANGQQAGQGNTGKDGTNNAADGQGLANGSETQSTENPQSGVDIIA